MSYYDNTQWLASGQASAGWDHATPPARSGANSAVPREEATAFAYQIEEIERAYENLARSGKMFGFPRPSSVLPPSNVRSHPMEFGTDSRSSMPATNLQNFYASQRHQPSRGSNEAEHITQAKRRMAAQRERELRNYHQEQQFNRTFVSDNSSYGSKTDRALSPAGMTEEERRDLIARQRSALYGEGPFADGSGYVDESGTPRRGVPGSVSLRGHSPLVFEYGHPAPPAHPDASSQQASTEGAAPASQSTGLNSRSRANSPTSPQSNNQGARVFDHGSAAPASTARTTNSSPTGSPPHSGSVPGSKPLLSAVAPIGTRPVASSSTAPSNHGLAKSTGTPLASPLSQGYNGSNLGGDDGKNSQISSTISANQSTLVTADGPTVGLASWGGRPAGWTTKSGLGSVWG